MNHMNLKESILLRELSAVWYTHSHIMAIVKSAGRSASESSSPRKAGAPEQSKMPSKSVGPPGKVRMNGFTVPRRPPVPVPRWC